MQSGAPGEKRSVATRPAKKALLTRRAKREVQKMNRAEQLRVTDAATVARAVGPPRSSCWVRATIVSGTTLPFSARAAGHGRSRLAHYSKSGMQSRAAAAASADNNFLGRTFFVAEFSRQQFSPFGSFSRTLPSDSDRSLAPRSFEITFRILRC